MVTLRGVIEVDGKEFLPFVGVRPDKAVQDISQKLRKRAVYVPHPEGGDDVVA